MSHFLKGAQALKVKEVPSYVTGYAKEHLTYSKVEPRVKTFLQDYKAKYIDTGSAAPLVHLMTGVFFLSYAIAWPGEYRHKKAEEAAKLAGKSGH